MVKYCEWKLSAKQIKFLYMIKKGIDLTKEYEKDKSNFIKARKNLMNKGLIKITKSYLMDGWVYSYSLTEKGRMFLKIIS